jgi:enoyl-CoA hydratase
MSDDSQTAPLLIDTDGPVRIVRLNRPEALNAADEALHARLASVWDELAEDDECRAVVLTGQGRAFSAGGDFGVLTKMNDSEIYRRKTLDEGARIVRSMAGFPLPIVAAVNGPAVGLGCSLAGLCDIVLIESSAYLADPHVSVGLVAGDGGAITWPALTSLLKAKEYLFLGDRISSDVAVNLGLANRVVPDGTSVEEALALAHRLAKQPAQALRDTKRAINRHLQMSIHAVLDYALSAEAISSASSEHRAIVDRMSAPRER